MIPVRVESKGSIWLLDDDLGRYARMPKTEGPRQSPPGADWGGRTAGPLEDLCWHPMVRWQILSPGPNPWTMQPTLIIDVGDPDGRKVIAPDAVLILP